MHNTKDEEKIFKGTHIEYTDYILVQIKKLQWWIFITKNEY